MWLNRKFPSYSKNSSWDVFVTVPNEVLKALNNLGSSDTRSLADVKPLELFVIQLYCCRHKIPPNNHDLAALKWHMFFKQQLDSQKVDSPTREHFDKKFFKHITLLFSANHLIFLRPCCQTQEIMAGNRIVLTHCRKLLPLHSLQLQKQKYMSPL